MKTHLFFVRKKPDTDITDEQLVEELMDLAMVRFPVIEGYAWEPSNGGVQILMWGDISDD